MQNVNEIDFEKQMRSKYPLMLNDGYGGFCVSTGWYQLIETLCDNIQNYLDWKNKKQLIVPQVKVVQVKEKFGGLRFYYDGGDEHIHGMVQIAEAMSVHICEVCGKPGKLRSGGWIRTLCDDHHVEIK